MNAKGVAKDVIAILGKGKKLNLKNVLQKYGYAPGVLKNPHTVTRTKSFQEAMKQTLPLLEQQRTRMILAIQNRDLDVVKFSDLLSGLEILTKNIQIISGKSTENVAIHVEISESIAKKNNLLAQTAGETTTQTEQPVKEIKEATVVTP
jgi:hypothetical protein